MFERMLRCLVIFNHNDRLQASARITEITNAISRPARIAFYTVLVGKQCGHRRPSRHSVKASPNDHIAAPSKTTSFSRNCPTAPERAGKPPTLGSPPGVENKNQSVVRNITTPTPLPFHHTF